MTLNVESFAACCFRTWLRSIRGDMGTLLNK
jgi:hypothetical protein